MSGALRPVHPALRGCLAAPMVAYDLVLPFEAVHVGVPSTAATVIIAVDEPLALAVSRFGKVDFSSSCYASTYVGVAVPLPLDRQCHSRTSPCCRDSMIVPYGRQESKWDKAISENKVQFRPKRCTTLSNA